MALALLRAGLCLFCSLTQTQREEFPGFSSQGLKCYWNGSASRALPFVPSSWLLVSCTLFCHFSVLTLSHHHIAKQSFGFPMEAMHWSLTDDVLSDAQCPQNLLSLYVVTHGHVHTFLPLLFIWMSRAVSISNRKKSKVPAFDFKSPLERITKIS